MIQELFEKAAVMHGHKCPGLAIGVRAAAEAIRLLGIENIHSHGLYCIAENRACYIDGLQTVFGTTLGNGNLEIRPRGKTAFNFYDRLAGKSLRLIAGSWPEGLSRQEMIAFILTAPPERVFTRTPVRFEAPEDRVILFPDRKLTWIFELKLRQTRRLSQSIMDIYGQERQRSMAQFQPEGLSDFY